MINKVKSAIAAGRRRKRGKRQAELRRKLKFPEPFATIASAQIYVPRFKYSVVTAAYGVEAYIDDFFSSLMQQTVGFRESIEVIVVDDGSKDNTLEKARAWERRYPGNIKVLTQNNGGPAEARNAGLLLVNHDWVTFTDPDDMLAQDYFENVDRGICRNLDAGVQVDMVACPMLFYRESSGAIRDGHPIKFSYLNGDKVVSFRDDSCRDMKLSAASSFLKRDSIFRNALTFPDIKPSFEDAVFLAMYLLKTNLGNVLFVSSASYFYRKREDGSSILDSVMSRKEKYIDQLRDGNLWLLEHASKMKGHCPRWVQRMVFYDLVWHFKVFFNNHKNWSLVQDYFRDEYFSLLSEIIARIDSDVILNFELANIPAHLKLGILSKFKAHHGDLGFAHVVEVDAKKHEALIGLYHTQPVVDFKILMGGEESSPVTSTSRVFEYFDEPLVYETLVWVRWRKDETLSCRLDGGGIPLKVKGEAFQNLSWGELINRFSIVAPKSSVLPVEKRLIKLLSRQSFVRERYKNAWLLMDRDTQADDNAEHLYRFLMKNHPEVNSWFVLRRTSHDWDRLKREGFRLLDFGSVGHKLALLNSDHLISSHADQYLFSVLPDKFYSDLTKYKFTFLQHGVTKDDLSNWLNNKDIKLFVTAAGPEYESIVKSGPYKYTQKDVGLTGFPRHDRLYELNQKRVKVSKKTILIMPTWRQGLAGESLGLGNSRAYNPEFIHSEFFKNWQAFLVNERLVNIIEMSDVDIVFYPHANLTPYIKDFQVKGMKVVSHSDGGSIQDYLVDADLLVTDYSSIAFESGFLGKSIVYFQFDRDSVFNGGHTYRKGYFDYDEHGFGPVALNVDALMGHIESIVDNNFVPSAQYSRRMREFFAYRDGGNCERVYERIKALDSPEPSIIDAIATR